MQTPDKQLSAEQSRQVAEQVREELARRRISRQTLAEQAKLSLSTLEKVLGGRRPFTLATTVRLEEALSGNDPSFFYRVRGPALAARDILTRYPFAGAFISELRKMSEFPAPSLAHRFAQPRLEVAKEREGPMARPLLAHEHQWDLR